MEGKPVHLYGKREGVPCISVNEEHVSSQNIIPLLCVLVSK